MKAEHAWYYWEYPPAPVTACSVCVQPQVPRCRMGMPMPEAGLGDKSNSGVCVPSELMGGSSKLPTDAPNCPEEPSSGSICLLLLLSILALQVLCCLRTTGFKNNNKKKPLRGNPPKLPLLLRRRVAPMQPPQGREKSPFKISSKPTRAAY